MSGIEPHLHCDMCGAVIKKYRVEGGRKSLNKVSMVGKITPLVENGQIGFVPIPVPLCESCGMEAAKGENQSKLIIPGQMPKTKYN